MFQQSTFWGHWQGRETGEISATKTFSQGNQLDTFKSEDHVLFSKAYLGYQKKKGNSFK